jgi:hypothetical protein
MPFEYQYQRPSPLINTNQGLMDLLTQQIESLSRGPVGPNYGNTQQAFEDAQRASISRQGDITRQSQQGAAERAAASGKTLSSSAVAEQGRIAQQGGNELASILGMLGLQEQGVLGGQAEAAAQFQQNRLGQVNQLLASVGGLAGGEGSGSGSGVPSYEQQRADYQSDVLQGRRFQQQDRRRAQGDLATQQFQARRAKEQQNQEIARLMATVGQGQKGLSPLVQDPLQGGTDFSILTGRPLQRTFSPSDPRQDQLALQQSAGNTQLMQMLMQMMAGGY